MKLDFSQIAENLYQGSEPPTGFAVRQAGFDVLVLCAREYQPFDQQFPGIEVVRCPIDDNLLPEDSDIALARATGRKVACYVVRGKRVLVTCKMGMNRSGLVTAFALHDIYGVSGAAAAKQVWTKRFGALFNPAFLNRLGDLQETRVRLVG